MAQADMNGSRSFPIVAVGCPAGGLESLQTFFTGLDPTLGAAFIVVADVGPALEAEAAAVVRKSTSMPAIELAGQGEWLRRDHVYVVRSNHHVLVAAGKISTMAETASKGSPIDNLLCSVADGHSEIFAVLLSGSGAGGGLGVKAIKEHAGVLLVEEAGATNANASLRNSVAAGLADVVVPAHRLAIRLAELLRGYFHLEQSVSDIEAHLRNILAYVRARTGQDFSHYKRSTVTRRLMRRIQVRGCEDLADYFKFLRDNPEEVDALFSDLLISVTAFFRDRDAFDALARTVLPILLADETNEAIRVWVPGCATGEEAYSIAILLLEEAARRELRPEIQIFATDLDPSVLAVAREGCYPDTIVAEVSEARLQRYFLREGNHYRIRKEVRDLIVFASHSLLKDPPFSRLDLVSCRNLLIYLERELQPQICSALHYALRPGRYLFLGPAETAEGGGIFQAVDRENRIYQAVEGSGRRHMGLPLHLLSPQPTQPPVRPSSRGSGPSDMAVHLGALEEFAPPSILVDRDQRIVHLSERAGQFLQPSGGALSTSISQIARPELRLDVRTGLHRAFEKGEESLSLPISVMLHGAAHRVFLKISPITSQKDQRRLALVMFIDAGPVSNSTDEVSAGTDAATDQIILQLQEEIQLTRERLKISREEYEATNEELRAANEELQSINEEYRSTAEELETSKEELQSMNEELQTLNAELKTKLEGVSRAHNDLQNLMSATEVGTLFLDTALCIKLFTPPIAEIFNITPGDHGRPITDLTHRLSFDGLERDAIGVLKDLMPQEREVESKAARWFLMRLKPYRTVDDRINGVVVTFVDITERRETERRLRRLTAELDHRVKNVLARVSVVIEKSRQGASSVDDLATSLKQRVRSMADTHALLSATQWSGARLQQIFTTELKPYALNDTFTYTGPDLNLRPDAAQAVALVIHELTTNAAKHGALSLPDGKVSFDVEILSQPTGPKLLRLVWKESGGRVVRPPARRSYGMHVIENLLAYEASAQTKLHFPREGVVCEIVMRLDVVEASCSTLSILPQ
ncbi:MAG: CheR family methyltransferase [Hyphomicrobium sp.]|jgi:two-component system CheB/CheR fusion protein